MPLPESVFLVDVINLAIKRAQSSSSTSFTEVQELSDAFSLSSCVSNKV